MSVLSMLVAYMIYSMYLFEKYTVYIKFWKYRPMEKMTPSCSYRIKEHVLLWKGSEKNHVGLLYSCDAKFEQDLNPHVVLFSVRELSVPDSRQRLCKILQFNDILIR